MITRMTTRKDTSFTLGLQQKETRKNINFKKKSSRECFAQEYP